MFSLHVRLFTWFTIDGDDNTDIFIINRLETSKIDAAYMSGRSTLSRSITIIFHSTFGMLSMHVHPVEKNSIKEIIPNDVNSPFN